MNIKHIQIRNILGIRELEVTPGQVTEISGKNGSGKSSLLGAIRVALGASEFSPAQLIHQGAEQGEVVLVLDDGTTIQRRIKPNGTDVKVTDAEGNKYQKPQSVLDRLFTITQFNPLRLLATDKKSRDERTKTVLECLPIEVTREQILELTPTLKSQVAMIDTNRHGLDVLNDIESRVFDRRTDVNRDLKKVTASILQIKETLPTEDIAEDPKARLEELRASKAQLDKKREEYFTTFESEHRAEREGAIDAAQALLAEAEQERQRAIDAANHAYEIQRTAIEDQKQVRILQAQQRYEAAKNEKQQAYESRLEPITAEMARLEEQTRTKAVIDTQRQMLAKLESEHADLDKQSETLTESIERVRAFRLGLLENFPIAGLELRDGEVYVDGLDFDQLNTARRIEIAVELAVMRSGDLGVICVDGCEALDAATFAKLEEVCAQKGLQMICTRVTDGPLTINAGEEVTA